MTKFKVGDKVKILDGSKIKNYFGGWLPGRMGKHVGEVYTVESVSEHSCSLKGIAWVWGIRGLELIKEKSRKPIVIYRKGNEVIAVDKKTGKKAIARCCPEDTFNFETGAKLAFERLFSSGDIVIGDKVHIINTGALYCTNIWKVMEMADNKKVLAQYAYGNNKGYPNKAVSGTYEVLNIDDEYVLIQKCIGVAPCSEVLLIGKRGLEKC